MTHLLLRTSFGLAAAFALSAAFASLGCGGVQGGSDTTTTGTGTTGTGGHQGGSGGATSSSASGGMGGMGSTGGGGSAPCGPDGPAPDEVLPGTADPEAGNFTLDEALVDLPAGAGPLRAIIETELGTLTCTLSPGKAPNGVANFVGLARGRRAFQDAKTKKWVRRKFYDGLLFHRVIPGFVAQGGDPLGTGYGGPGYEFNDEISDLMHVAGALAYANAGANTNGSQFYITEKPQPGLDGDYTIFGVCDPVSVVEDLTHVPTDKDDKPLKPIHMTSVTITRCPLP